MITTILLFLNAAFYLIPNLIDGNLNGEGQTFARVMDAGSQRSSAIENGEYYRFFTATFLHWSLIHFALNMYSLYILGPTVEASFGPARYITLYLISGVAGGLVTYFFGPLFGQSPASVSAGASGAILGLVGALIVFSYFNPTQFIQGATTQLIGITVINLIFGFMNPNQIGNAAHVGGLATGLLIGFIFGR